MQISSEKENKRSISAEERTKAEATPLGSLASTKHNSRKTSMRGLTN